MQLRGKRENGEIVVGKGEEKRGQRGPRSLFSQIVVWRRERPSRDIPGARGACVYNVYQTPIPPGVIHDYMRRGDTSGKVSGRCVFLFSWSKLPLDTADPVRCTFPAPACPCPSECNVQPHVARGHLFKVRPLKKRGRGESGEKLGRNHAWDPLLFSLLLSFLCSSSLSSSLSPLQPRPENS